MARLTSIIAALLLSASASVGCHAYPTRERFGTEHPRENEQPVYSFCEPHESYCQVGFFYDEDGVPRLRMYASAVVFGKRQPPGFHPFFVEECDGLLSHITDDGCDGVEQVGSFKPSRELRAYHITP